MTTPQPPPQYPRHPPSPYGSAPVRKRPPTWLIVLGVMVPVFVLVGIVGANVDSSESRFPAFLPNTAPLTAPLDPPAAASPPLVPPATASPTPSVAVVLPEVQGRNGQIVLDELAKLGLTNVTTASANPQDTLVLVAANWTVVDIEPGPGETVQADQTVVVTMTKRN